MADKDERSYETSADFLQGSVVLSICRLSSSKVEKACAFYPSGVSGVEVVGDRSDRPPLVPSFPRSNKQRKTHHTMQVE